MSWFKLGGKKEDPPKVADEPAQGSPPASDPAVEAALDAVPERKVPDELADLFLVMEEHLTEVELEDLQQLIANLKQPPPLVEKLTSGLDDPEELREAILSSPSLSADVLRVVNSAAFALNSPISSIDHAVTYLGTTMVKGLVLQSAVTQVMSFETDVQKAAYMRIWRGSYVASATAQAYAQVLDLRHPSVYATRGLLSAVGDLALISARPDLAVIYAPKTELLSRIDGQQREIMANSAVLSALLVRAWGLPDDLVDALRYGLTPLSLAADQNPRSPDDQRDDLLLYMACRVGDAVAYGGLGNVGDFDALTSESPDYFYLPDYLRRLELGELLPVLKDRQHAGRVQRIVDTFGK